ncbi:MAG: hypothetical protein R3E91_00265 [Chlamydiales bacterium]
MEAKINSPFQYTTDESIVYSSQKSHLEKKETIIAHKVFSESERSVQESSHPIQINNRTTNLPTRCLNFFKDEGYMSFIVDLFGISTQSLDLIGNVAAGYAPYLSIASSPFYLYHALKNSKERFQLMWRAAKTAQISDAVFLFGQGIDSTGTAISDVTKPFANGFYLAGLTSQHLVLGICFTLILPIILIVFGTIGGICKGWSMIRTQKVLRQFNDISKLEDSSFEALNKVLGHLLGEDLVKKDLKKTNLSLTLFNENHFTNTDRRKVIQDRICELKKKEIHFFKTNKSFSPSIKKDIQPSDEEDLNDLTDFQSIGMFLDEYETSLENLNKDINPLDNGNFQEVKESIKKLKEFRKEITAERKEIIGLTRSEMHRKICYHALFILMALMTLTAGILLIQNQYANIGRILNITTSTLSIGYVIFEKTVSQKSFYKIDSYLHKPIKTQRMTIDRLGLNSSDVLIA